MWAVGLGAGEDGMRKWDDRGGFHTVEGVKYKQIIAEYLFKGNKTPQPPSGRVHLSRRLGDGRNVRNIMTFVRRKLMLVVA